MCSVLTHPVVPIALAPLLPQGALSPPLLLVGAACSVIPDLDVIGIKFGLYAHGAPSFPMDVRNNPKLG